MNVNGGKWIPDGITPTEWGGLRLHYKSLCMGYFVAKNGLVPSFL